MKGIVDFFKIKKDDFALLTTDYIVSRLFLVIGLYLFWNLDMGLLWDCSHYIDIAKNGYVLEAYYAFFPLIPLIIKFFSLTGLLIIDQFAVIISIFLFYNLTKEYFKTKNPLLVSRLWIWSPISVVTILCYTESLFIFLTLFSFYLYKKEKHHILCGIMLGLSVMCRSTGSLLFFTLFIFMFVKFLKKKEKFANILKVYIPATIISCIYPIYLQIHTGNWKKFIDIQYTFWQKQHSNIFVVLANFKNIFNEEPINIPFALINYFYTFILLAIIVFCIAKIYKNKYYGEIIIYIILSLIAIFSTCKTVFDPTVSYYRYMFGCFSIYFILPQNKWFLRLTIIMTFFISFFFLANRYFY